LTTYTPTQAKELMFGNTLVGPIRNYLEPVSADEQCHRAGVEFNPATTTCWLCGCIIGDEPKACEHIIPALRAIMFSGMITTKKIMSGILEAAGDSDELLQRVTNNNYLWAHDNCNGSGAKGGMVLFKFDDKSGMFVVDKAKCNELQTKIRMLRPDCYNKEDSTQNIYDNLVFQITRRLEDINHEYEEFVRLIPPENRQYGIRYYSEYTMEIIKIYASAEAIDLLLTDAQRAEKAAQTASAKKAAEELATEALAEQIRIQQKAAEAAEKNYSDFLRILEKMKEKEIESRGSVYRRIEDINIELKTRKLCAYYLQRGFADSKPITLSLEINQVSEYVSHEIEKVLADLFPLLGGDITIIESLIAIISNTLIFREAKARGLPMATGSSRSSVITDIKDLKCNSFADLYINIVHKSTNKLTDIQGNLIDPMTNDLFRRIVATLKTNDIDYTDCVDIMEERISRNVQSATSTPLASQEAYTDEQLMARQNSQGEEIGSYAVEDSDMDEDDGDKFGGKKTNNVTKKNKKTKNRNTKKNKKTKKIRKIKKIKKIRNIRKTKKL
jgi:DNA-binding transcriptional MerR regulator